MNEAQEKLSIAILTHLLPFGNFGNKNTGLREINDIHLKKIQDRVINKQIIQFVLPAFPAKSRNNEKTYSHLPDFGEVEALRRMNEMAKQICEIYKPGVEIVICSDGRVFSDLVGVTEDDVSEYRVSIKSIASEFKLNKLKFFDLEDIYQGDITYSEMRESLERDHAKCLEGLKSSVKTDIATGVMFNGIHRFIKEDYLILKPDMSKNQITKLSKAIAYQVILRSNAWSSLVEDVYPDAVRLSIHPQSKESKKFPIQLIPCSENWGTPWHRVPVLKRGKLELMRKLEVEKLGGVLKRFSDKYVYFELGTSL